MDLKSIIAHPIVAIVALLVAPVGFYHWSQASAAKQGAAVEAPSLWNSDSSAASSSEDHEVADLKIVNSPGVRPSEFRTGPVQGILETDPVIGVIVDGKPRAYLVNALCSLNACVVNDVHNGRPLSIIYAIENGIPRVLTIRNDALQTEPAEPLELGIHGLVQRDLYISYQGHDTYFSSKFRSLVDYPHSHCSWKVWSNAFPDTDIYTGDVLR